MSFGNINLVNFEVIMLLQMYEIMPLLFYFHLIQMTHLRPSIFNCKTEDQLCCDGVMLEIFEDHIFQ